MRETEDNAGKCRSYAELFGCSRLRAEGCLGLVLCGEEQIRLRLGGKDMLISGQGLVIEAMCGQTVEIAGNITGVEFL